MIRTMKKNQQAKGIERVGGFIVGRKVQEGSDVGAET